MRTLKSQTLTATPLFGHTKILHTLVGLGSAALPALRRLDFPQGIDEVFERRRSVCVGMGGGMGLGGGGGNGEKRTSDCRSHDLWT